MSLLPLPITSGSCLEPRLINCRIRRRGAFPVSPSPARSQLDLDAISQPGVAGLTRPAQKSLRPGLVLCYFSCSCFSQREGCTGVHVPVLVMQSHCTNFAQQAAEKTFLMHGPRFLCSNVHSFRLFGPEDMLQLGYSGRHYFSVMSLLWLSIYFFGVQLFDDLRCWYG